MNGVETRAHNDAEAVRAPSLVVKAGALMEALAQERIATSARLTQLINEPVSSVYRLLATLADIGWVEQIEHRGAYRIGGKLLSLANEFTRHLDIRRASLPVLKRIHEATGETTFLCVRHGTRAVCIERIDGVRVNSQYCGWAAHCRCTLAQRPVRCWLSRTAKGGRSTPRSRH